MSSQMEWFNLQSIFKKECRQHQEYFSEDDDVRKRVYLLLSNSTTLLETCSKMVAEFTSLAKNIIIQEKQLDKDLMSLLNSKTDRVFLIMDGHEENKELGIVKVTKMSVPLFTKVILDANNSTSARIKPHTSAFAYSEVQGKTIGFQHIMYTTNPGAASDSSSAENLLDSEDDNCDGLPGSANTTHSSHSGTSQGAPQKVSTPSKRTSIHVLGSPAVKKLKTCQKAGAFELGYHADNSSFNNRVKCQVEIFILIGNESFCEILATHLGLIYYESLLKGENYVERRLGSPENNIYRLAHTGIIKKLMQGHSNICITTSREAWLNTQAHVKAIIYTKEDKSVLEAGFAKASYVISVNSHILSYIEAVSEIINESLHCNIKVEANYEVRENVFSKIHVPLTVVIPLYILRYFTQSYNVTHSFSQIKDVLDPQTADD